MFEEGRLIQLLVAANVVTSQPIFVTLMMETCSSETSLLTRATRRHMNMPFD
jgi:hypothetical protein